MLSRVNWARSKQTRPYSKFSTVPTPSSFLTNQLPSSLFTFVAPAETWRASSTTTLKTKGRVWLLIADFKPQSEEKPWAIKLHVCCASIYIYVKRSKTCGRASSDKGSDSFSHPQTRFSTPQCNCTAVFASSRSVFTARLAVSCLNTIQSFLRSYSLSALCLWVFFSSFVSSIGNRENHNNRELCQTRQEHKGKE